MANGTAPQCGRVGNRHILLQKPLTDKVRGFVVLEEKRVKRILSIQAQSTNKDIFIFLISKFLIQGFKSYGQKKIFLFITQPFFDLEKKIILSSQTSKIIGVC